MFSMALFFPQYRQYCFNGLEKNMLYILFLSFNKALTVNS